jgi:hypothetical protein
MADVPTGPSLDSTSHYANLKKLKKSMGSHFSLKSISSSVSEEIHSVYRSRRFSIDVYPKSNESISQPHNVSLWFFFILYLFLFVSNDFYFQVSRLNYLYAFPFSPIPHPPWFAHVIICIESYKSWHFSCYSFLKPTLSSCLIDPKVILSTLFSNIPQSILFY